MLDGLLGRSGFSSKCKSLIKPTRSRIEVLRRRAEAKQRFLKEDLAKLLANGLDVNAYGRTEEFIAGLNLLSCYSFIDQSCEYILKQLSVMQKLGQCPEECRETVASLMFAAARFSDLPELRDLRDVFQDRYGTGLECYVNQMFVEKIASKPPVVEKRIKLLQDIAAEFSIQWDSNGFKQRMDKTSTLAQDPAKKLGPSVTDDKYKVQNGNNFFRKNDHRSKERIELAPELHNNGNVNVRKKEVINIPIIGREEKRSKERIENGHEGPMLHADRNINARLKEVLAVPVVEKEEKRSYKHEGPTTKLENGGYLSKPRPQFDSDNNRIGKTDFPFMMKSSGSDRRPEIMNNDRVNRGRKERHAYKYEETIESVDNNDGLFRGRQESTTNNHTPSAGLKSPTRPDRLYRVKSEGVSNGNGNGEESIKLKKFNSLPPPPPYVKSNIPPPYGKPLNSNKIHNKTDTPYHENGPHRSCDELSTHNLLNTNDIPLPKPRSIRRKHSKSSSSHDDIGSSEDARIVKRISSSRRKERKGLQILFDDEHYHKDEEEKMMDKLLLHYSKKPSAYDVAKLRRKKSRSHASSKSPHQRSGDDVAEVVVPPVRSISLPHESGEPEVKKVYARANSFQPDNQAPHVHPKLPDYDDLAARFAALRGR